jgi:hypothetical protein
MKKLSYSHLFVTLSLVAMLLVIFVNYFVDPFTYYHRPWTTINISKNHRYSNPGLARQYDYKTVLVGTSHVMELSSARLTEIVGETAINLSSTGGLIREQSQLIELILRQGKARTILWEMNYPSFALGDVFSEPGQEFPQYFYTPSVETPFRYLMSFDTLLESKKALTGAGRITVDNRNQLPVQTFSRQRVLANWDFQINRWDENLVRIWARHQQTVLSPARLLETRVLPLVRQNPDVRFKFFLPPTSVMYFLLYQSRGENDFKIWLDFRDSIAEIMGREPNVELFDFHSNWETISNLELYRDLQHYNLDILDEMFVQISDGSGRVDRQSILANTRQLQRQVNEYGVAFCGRQPERCPASLNNRLGLSQANRR